MKKLVTLTAVAALVFGLTSVARAQPTTTCAGQITNLVLKDGTDVGNVALSCTADVLNVNICTSSSCDTGNHVLLQTTVDLDTNATCDNLRNRNDNPKVGTGTETSTRTSSRGENVQLHTHGLNVYEFGGVTICVLIDALLFDTDAGGGRPFATGFAEGTPLGGKSGHEFLTEFIVNDD